MALLSKVKSATLMEALVATILIIIIFVIASLVLNNLLLNTFAKNTHKINYRINELEYDIQNGQLAMPYEENHEGWDITIKKVESEDIIIILASNQEGKEISRKRLYAE